MAEIKRCQYLGYVDDIHALYRQYAIFVNPMRLGGGTRLKMLEAMGFGMACVSSSIGAEGLEVKDGVHFITADDPEQMAEQIRILASDPSRTSKLGNEARKMVISRFTWTRCLRPLVDYYKGQRSH